MVQSTPTFTDRTSIQDTNPVICIALNTPNMLIFINLRIIQNLLGIWKETLIVSLGYNNSKHTLSQTRDSSNALRYNTTRPIRYPLTVLRCCAVILMYVVDYYLPSEAQK